MQPGTKHELTQSCHIGRCEGAARCVQHGRPDKGALARRDRTGQPARAGLPAASARCGAASARRGSERLARVSRLAKDGSDARACVCPWIAGNRQRQPLRVGKRLRARFRQTRPAGDLHRTRCNYRRGLSPGDLQMRCRQQDPTVCSVLCGLRARYPATRRKTRPGLLERPASTAPAVRSGRSVGVDPIVSYPAPPPAPTVVHASPVPKYLAAPRWILRCPPCKGVLGGTPLPQAGPAAGSRSLRERLVPHSASLSRAASSSSGALGASCPDHERSRRARDTLAAANGASLVRNFQKVRIAEREAIVRSVAHRAPQFSELYDVLRGELETATRRAAVAGDGSDEYLAPGSRQSRRIGSGPQ